MRYEIGSKMKTRGRMISSTKKCSNHYFQATCFQGHFYYLTPSFPDEVEVFSVLLLFLENPGPQQTRTNVLVSVSFYYNLSREVVPLGVNQTPNNKVVNKPGKSPFGIETRPTCPIEPSRPCLLPLLPLEVVATTPVPSSLLVVPTSVSNQSRTGGLGSTVDRTGITLSSLRPPTTSSLSSLLGRINSSSCLTESFV